MNRRGDIRLTFFVAYGILLVLSGAIMWNMNRTIVELRTPKHISDCRDHLSTIRAEIEIYQCQDRIFVEERP